VLLASLMALRREYPHFYEFRCVNAIPAIKLDSSGSPSVLGRHR
jgi:hypothetical protein